MLQNNFEYKLFLQSDNYKSHFLYEYGNLDSKNGYYPILIH